MRDPILHIGGPLDGKELLLLHGSHSIAWAGDSRFVYDKRRVEVAGMPIDVMVLSGMEESEALAVLGKHLEGRVI